jgi:hypothetical protein
VSVAPDRDQRLGDAAARQPGFHRRSHSRPPAPGRVDREIAIDDANGSPVDQLLELTNGRDTDRGFTAAG